MTTFSIEDIINNNLSFEWPCSDFDAYSKMVAYLTDKKFYDGDEIFSYYKGLVFDASGNLINYYYEDLDISGLLDTPPDFSVNLSDVNVPFSLIPATSNKTMNVKFHYILTSNDYLSTLNRKKRWKFKNELKKETVNTIIPADIDDEFALFFKNKLILLNREDDYIDLYSVLILLKNTKHKVKAYKLYNNDGLCGISALIEIKGVSYVAVFNSTSPCLYTYVKFLIEDIFEENKIIHFGASIDYEKGNVFDYKKNISNNFTLVPYMYVGEGEGQPPYYSLDRKTWVLK